MKYAYFKGKESETFRFVQVPYVFFEDEKFKKLSADAKLLFGLLLGRMSLSRENNWFDEDNNVYIKWSQEKIGAKLGRSKPTVIKIMKELVAVGLIEYPKHGQGDCATIYVKDFLHELNEEYNEEEPETLENTEKSKSFTSRSKEVLPQEVKVLNPNYIDTNYIKENYTTTPDSVVVDDNIPSIFSDLDLSLSDSDIRAILRAAKNDLAICKKAIDYVKRYKGPIDNVVGFIISFIRKGGYNNVSRSQPSVSANQSFIRNNYNMPYLEWIAYHNDEDPVTWIKSAEELLGYPLSETQRNNIPEVLRLIENKFINHNTMNVAI